MSAVLTEKNLKKLHSSDNETISTHSSHNEYYNSDLVTHKTYDDYLAAQGLDKLEGIIANEKSTSEAKAIKQNFANLIIAAKTSDSFFFINALGHAILKFESAMYAENAINNFKELFIDPKLPIFLVAIIIRINEEKKKQEAIKHNKEAQLKIETISNNNNNNAVLAKLEEDIRATDLSRSSEAGIDGAIKGLLKIPVVNDTASLVVISGFLEPRLRAARFNVYYDHFLRHFLALQKEGTRDRDKDYFEDTENCVAVSDETLTRLMQCTKDYINTAGRETHPGNMSLLPKAMTETYRAVLMAFLIMNLNSQSYKKSETVEWTLYCDDGTSYKVHIPEAAFGHFISFLNIRQLQELLKISNQKFEEKIKKNSKKALLRRSITDESLETSFNNLLYDPDFAILQPLLLLPSEYHHFLNKNLFDSVTIDFEQSIKAVFNDFLKNEIPITNDDKELSNELDALLKNLNGNNPKQELEIFKSLIGQKMNALLNKEVAGKIREQIADQDFQAFLDELPSINSLSSGDIGLIITSIVQGKFQDLKTLKNQKLGNLLFNVLTRSKLAQLVLIALPASSNFFATVATTVIPNSAIGWLVKKQVKQNANLNVDTLKQLPGQIRALALEPDENLVPALKEIFGGAKGLSKEGQKWIKDAFSFRPTSQYCMKLKYLIANPINFSTLLNIFKNNKAFNTDPTFQTNLQETIAKWGNLIADLTKLRESANFAEEFMKFSQKKPYKGLLKNIALQPRIYNKYEPLIFCVLLNICELSKIHKENIVYKDSFYLAAVFQQMTTAVVALFLNQYKKEEDTSRIRPKLRSEAQKIGLSHTTTYYKAIRNEKGDLAFDQNGILLCEQREGSYSEIEKVVCESLTFAGHKFSKNDPNFQFLIQHYSRGENKKLLAELPSDNEVQSDSTPALKLNTELLKRTKDVLMKDFAKLDKQEKIGRLFILLSLAAKTKNNEYTYGAIFLALQYIDDPDFNGLVNEYFKKQPDGAVKEDVLSSLIANGHCDLIETLLKKTTEFNLSILTAKGFNPILSANAAISNAQKHNKDKEQIVDHTKILNLVIKRCVDKKELLPLVRALQIIVDEKSDFIAYGGVVERLMDALLKKLNFNFNDTVNSTRKYTPPKVNGKLSGLKSNSDKLSSSELSGVTEFFSSEISFFTQVLTGEKNIRGLVDDYATRPNQLIEIINESLKDLDLNNQTKTDRMCEVLGELEKFAKKDNNAKIIFDGIKKNIEDKFGTSEDLSTLKSPVKSASGASENLSSNPLISTVKYPKDEIVFEL